MEEIIKNIYNKLFYLPEDKFVVVYNYDGFLMTKDVKEGLKNVYNVLVFYGDELDLRLVWERRMKYPDSKILFIKDTNFTLMEDIAREISTLKYIAPIEIKPSPRKNDNAYDVLSQIKNQWNNNFVDIDFFKPSDWMNKAGQIILEALKSEKWSEFRDNLIPVNDRFNEFLKKNYVNIVSSSVGLSAPRIVTQVLPFLHRFDFAKKALIVIDGMNYWQSTMLCESLQNELGVGIKRDCMYSWLPSVTELSRQAIFRGDDPIVEYDQNPTNEKGLWKSFWEIKGVRGNLQYYQYGGKIIEGLNSKVLAYVTLDLDVKMHASDNYEYLYDLTRRWLKDGDLIVNIKELIENGFKIFITTDHGNIEGTRYRSFDSRDRIDAERSYRHITISEYKDQKIFESQYKGHLLKIDESSRTYYAVGTEMFTSKNHCVTHGGTHFMEVLIPFITIN
ncbi:MAG: PglZ domain-containing protein [Clostridia bacterium]|nr:PglZ domain-containing protein [Clostridia bacterium]